MRFPSHDRCLLLAGAFLVASNGYTAADRHRECCGCATGGSRSTHKRNVNEGRRRRADRVPVCCFGPGLLRALPFEYDSVALPPHANAFVSLGNSDYHHEDVYCWAHSSSRDIHYPMCRTKRLGRSTDVPTGLGARGRRNQLRPWPSCLHKTRVKTPPQAGPSLCKLAHASTLLLL